MENSAGKVLAIAVGVLVLLAVVAGVLSATRQGPQLPEGSAEATVQAYLRAVAEGDEEAAAALLDPQGRCTEEDLRMYGGPGPTGRIVLRDVEVDGDEAEVQVEVVYGEEGPFGGGEWSEDIRFDLRRDGEAWVITGEPWPMYGCSDVKPVP